MSGRLTYGEIKDEAGNPRTTTAVVADDVIFFQTSDSWWVELKKIIVALSGLEKLIEALYNEDIHLSRRIQVPNWEIIWLQDLKLELLI